MLICHIIEYKQSTSNNRVIGGGPDPASLSSGDPGAPRTPLADPSHAFPLFRPCHWPRRGGRASVHAPVVIVAVATPVVLGRGCASCALGVQVGVWLVRCLLAGVWLRSLRALPLVSDLASVPDPGKQQALVAVTTPVLQSRLFSKS